MHHRKIVVIGINRVTLMTRWQVQKLLGEAPIGYFPSIEDCPPLASDIGVLLLTSRKPPTDQLKQLFGQNAVYHAPLKPGDAKTLTLSVLEEITSRHPSKGRQVQLHWRDANAEPANFNTQEDDLAEAA